MPRLLLEFFPPPLPAVGVEEGMWLGLYWSFFFPFCLSVQEGSLWIKLESFFFFFLVRILRVR